MKSLLKRSVTNILSSTMIFSSSPDEKEGEVSLENFVEFRQSSQMSRSKVPPKNDPLIAQ